MIKKLYICIVKHPICAIRLLFLMSIIAVVIEPFNDAIFKGIMLACLAVSLTMQIGNSCKWER